MNRLTLISYHASAVANNEHALKDVFDKSIHLNESLSKESVEYCIDKYNLTDTDLIFIHSSYNLEIAGYKIIYFSFGCGNCGDKKENGELLEEIIDKISRDEKTNTEICRDRLFKCYDEKIEANREEERFLGEKKRLNIPKEFCLYLAEHLNMSPKVKDVFKTIKHPSSKEEILELAKKEEFIYLFVPFAGYGNPQILTQDGDTEAIDRHYNRYFLELKELQEESNYNIIFLFLSYNQHYIPNLFKKIQENETRTQKNINKIFISPIKRFNTDNHLKFLFTEILYTKNDKEPLNFFTFDSPIDFKKLQEYLRRDLPYRQLKKIYYESLFFDKKELTEEKLTKYKEYWNLHKELKYNKQDTENKEEIFHDLDLADIRTNMPFYFPSMLNKLYLIKQTFKDQTLDFLLIDDKGTIEHKSQEIKNILDLILLDTKERRKLYKLTAKEFHKNSFSEKERRKLIQLNDNKKDEENIRNTAFILVDFLLDDERIFFGSDFIERIEKQKKEDDLEFRSWYFITSYLSGYVNKFEIDKIMYEYYDSATVQIGDSTHRKFRIFFIKKLVYFIYSKVNIYIRINNITKKLITKKENNLTKKLIGLMQTLLQQIDLLELRYDNENIKVAEQFYSLISTILEDYMHRIYYQWEIKEIKFQQLKELKEKLSPTTNIEIRNLYKLIETLSSNKGKE